QSIRLKSAQLPSWSTSREREPNPIWQTVLRRPLANCISLKSCENNWNTSPDPDQIIRELQEIIEASVAARSAPATCGSRASATSTLALTDLTRGVCFQNGPAEYCYRCFCRSPELVSEPLTAGC